MVVNRMELREMQDRRQRAFILTEADGPSPDAVVISLGPAVATGDDPHPVGPERMKLTRLAADADGLDIGIAGDDEVAIERLAKGDAALARIGPLDQSQRRMLGLLAPADLGDQLRLRRRLGDQADAAMHHRIALIALPRERAIIARRPDRAPGLVQGDQRPDARALLFRRGEAAQAAKEIEHGFLAV